MAAGRGQVRDTRRTAQTPLKLVATYPVPDDFQGKV
ncbi:hypothetical protein [Bradyrhizobium sp. CCGUVB14]